MRESSYVLFSYEEAEVGARYVLEKYGFELNRYFLRTLGDETLSAMKKWFLTFEDARKQVFNRRFPYSKNEEGNKRVKEERKLCAAALGKMFSARSALKRRGRPAIKTTKRPRGYAESPTGQLEWSF